ncbi:MAG: hypothetical protein R3A13_02495 [Bdellovibrionota bacterium]
MKRKYCFILGVFTGAILIASLWYNTPEEGIGLSLLFDSELPIDSKEEAIRHALKSGILSAEAKVLYDVTNWTISAKVPDHGWEVELCGCDKIPTYHCIKTYNQQTGEEIETKECGWRK